MSKDNPKSNDHPSWEGFLGEKQSEQNADSTPNESGSKETTLFITGMTCSSCEVRIEHALSKIDGVTQAKVSFKDAKAVVSFDPGLVNEATLAEKVVALGYGTREKEKSFSVPQLIGIGALIAVFFLLLSQSGLFSLLPQIDKNAGYWILLLTGILTSVHCVGMCGAINISQSLKARETDRPAGFKRFLPGILYNAGRVVSYTVIGGIVGAIGGVVSFSGMTQSVIIVFAGLVMIVMGLNMLGVFPFLKRFQLRMPKFISTRIVKAVGGKGPFLVGLANGFMPCGPLQSMQLYALGTGSFLAGASSMFFFSIGTVPLLFGVSALSSVLTKKFALRMIKVSAMIVFFLGAGMIVRGLSLGGIGIQPVIAKPGNVADLRDDVQYVTTTLKSSSYEPITVYAGIPVKWTVNASADEINGCNSPMTIPSYNITRELVPGENTIEFTPGAPGNITYTCWMGMITSNIKVLPNPNAVPGSEAEYTSPVEPIDPNGPIATLPPVSTSSNTQAAVAVLAGGVQTVTTNLQLGSYTPIIVQKGMPVRWTFSADKSNLTSCNYRIVIRDLNIQKELVPGDNVIEFTPLTEGKIDYTCWMNMMHSAIYVVADLGDTSAVAAAKNSTAQIPQTSGGCCGAGATAKAKLDIDPKDIPLGIAQIRGGVQVVSTDLGPWGYTPVIVQKGIPVRWEFNADQKSLSKCNYRFVIPDLNLKKELVAGANIIEFTPGQEGVIPFSCWMQMISSGIFVLADINDRVSIEAIRTKWVDYVLSGASSGSGGSGGGCCGG